MSKEKLKSLYKWNIFVVICDTDLHKIISQWWYHLNK